MRSTYRVLAYLMALEVVVQAGAIAYALAGLGTWIQEGGVLDKAAMESESVEFAGVGGFMLHGINGEMIIPVVAVALLVVSFFAKVPGGVAVQIMLGVFGRGLPLLILVHGMLALAIFAVALAAARKAGGGAPAAVHSDKRAAGVA